MNKSKLIHFGDKFFNRTITNLDLRIGNVRNPEISSSFTGIVQYPQVGLKWYDHDKFPSLNEKTRS